MRHTVAIVAATVAVGLAAGIGTSAVLDRADGTAGPGTGQTTGQTAGPDRVTVCLSEDDCLSGYYAGRWHVVPDHDNGYRNVTVR
jgi:hypothetical protein